MDRPTVSSNAMLVVASPGVPDSLSLKGTACSHGCLSAMLLLCQLCKPQERVALDPPVAQKRMAQPEASTGSCSAGGQRADRAHTSAAACAFSSETLSFSRGASIGGLTLLCSALGGIAASSKSLLAL